MSELVNYRNIICADASTLYYLADYKSNVNNDIDYSVQLYYIIIYINQSTARPTIIHSQW